MKLKYLFLFALCIVGAIAHRTRQNDSEHRRLQRSDEQNALTEGSNSDVSSLEEDALADPLPDDANIPKESPKWGKYGKRKNRKWRKNKCRNENKTEGAAEDGENNKEQSEIKCERHRHRGWRRRGNKDKKDSNEEDQNENKHDRHHHHHHHCKGNKTESDDSVHGQDGNIERHHHGWRKHGRKNQNEQTDEQDDNQIENEEGKRGRYRHRGYHHRGHKNENGESVHDSEWHKNHNVPMTEGDSDVNRRGHHHHHHHHHCHNKTTTTTSTTLPPTTNAPSNPSNDDSVTEFDVRADVE